MSSQTVPGNQNLDKPGITVSLVQELVSEQFPQWAHLPIHPVALSGWDNRTFHLGKNMSVRLPSAERYAAKVKIEQEWLPKLAPHLSYTIPAPLALGQPNENYPWNWSVYQWIEGHNADTLSASDFNKFAIDIATFLNELYSIDSTDGILAGPHNFYRGTPPIVYDNETKSAISQLKGIIDTKAVEKIWGDSTRTKWHKDPVWIHGDFSVGNILVKDRRLTAVIDFGGMSIGDPACDLVIAWTFLNKESRHIFKSCMDLDADTWMRARGWCLWKALITLVPLKDQNNAEVLRQKHIIERVLNDN